MLPRSSWTAVVAKRRPINQRALRARTARENRRERRPLISRVGTALAGLLLPMGLLSLPNTAEATLFSRAGGLAYYDDLLNITWLADPNYANTSGFTFGYDGAMKFSCGDESGTQQTACGYLGWLNAQAHLGVTGWRLPQTPTVDPSCDLSGYNCTGGEMGSLYYITLGLAAGAPGAVGNSSPFATIVAGDHYYWTGTLLSTEPPEPISRFGWGNGGREDSFGGAHFGAAHAWAVVDGDVLLVPEPSTALLVGLGLLALATRKSLA